MTLFKKYAFLVLFIFALSIQTKAQKCVLLSQTFAVADTINKNHEQLYRFRFSEKQLNEIQVMPGLEKPVVAIRKLQRTLDEDFDSYSKALFWQLDTKLAQKQLEELRKECSETAFKAYEFEMVYYKSKYKAKEVK